MWGEGGGSGGGVAERSLSWEVIPVRQYLSWEVVWAGEGEGSALCSERAREDHRGRGALTWGSS